MAKRQSFTVGSTNPVTAEKTLAELNMAWNRLQVLKAGDLNGIFKSTSFYGNDSSNEIANAILYMTGEEPSGLSEHELADALQKFREDIMSKGLAFKGFISATEPDADRYSFENGNLWIKMATLPTEFPVQPVDTISITLSDDNTYDRDVASDLPETPLYAWKHIDDVVWTGTITPTTETPVYEYDMVQQEDTITAVEEGSITVNEIVYFRESEKDLDSHYAWMDENSNVLYTVSETPSVGDNVFKHEIIVSTKTISSLATEQIIKVWDGTQWADSTTPFQISDFDFFRNVNDNEGYYWFGGEWMIMSTDMSTDYFVINQTTGKWEIKSNVVLPGTPSTGATPSVSDTTKSIVNCEYIGNKFLVVNALPENPDPNVFYFVIGE